MSGKKYEKKQRQYTLLRMMKRIKARIAKKKVKVGFTIKEVDLTMVKIPADFRMTGLLINTAKGPNNDPFNSSDPQSNKNKNYGNN